MPPSKKKSRTSSAKVESSAKAPRKRWKTATDTIESLTPEEMARFKAADKRRRENNLKVLTAHSALVDARRDFNRIKQELKQAEEEYERLLQASERQENNGLESGESNAPPKTDLPSLKMEACIVPQVEHHAINAS